jgi:hypothetical protein
MHQMPSSRGVSNTSTHAFASTWFCETIILNIEPQWREVVSTHGQEKVIMLM